MKKTNIKLINDAIKLIDNGDYIDLYEHIYDARKMLVKAKDNYDMSFIHDVIMDLEDDDSVVLNNDDDSLKKAVSILKKIK